MKISTSTYYYKPKKNRAVRDFQDAQLRDEIEAIQADFPWAGYRTVQTYLFRRQGRWYNGKKIRRIMNKYGLKATIRTAFVRTTDSDHGLPVYPNLIRRDDFDRHQSALGCRYHLYPDCHGFCVSGGYSGRVFASYHRLGDFKVIESQVYY